MDAVQLSGGRVLVSMRNWQINFALLDGASYDVVNGPVGIGTFENSDGLSVTADQAGHGILTWTVYNSGNDLLYYALVDGNGTVLTNPVVFQNPSPANTGNYYLGVNYLGYANSSYSTPPTTSNVDTYITSPELIAAAPSGAAMLPISFGNKGASSASSIQVSVTLNGGLTYLSDTSGMAPSVVGNTYTWSLPSSLAFLSQGSFYVYIGMPNVSIGTRLPISLQVSSAGVEDFPADNTFNLEILASNQVFLPVISR